MKNKKILLTAATVATLSLAACNTYTNRAGHIDGYRNNHRTGHIDGYRNNHRTGHMDGYNNDNRAVIDGNRTGRMNDNRTGRMNDNRTGRMNDNRTGRMNDNRTGRMNDNRTGRMNDNQAGYYNGYNNRVGYNDASAGYSNSLDYNNDNRISNHAGTDTHLGFVSNHGFQNVANTNGTTYYQRYRLDSNNAGNNDIFHSWRHAWVEPSDYMGKNIDLYRYNGDINGQQRTIHILSHNGTPIGGYHYGHGETAEQGIMLKRDGFTSRGVNDFRGAWNGMFDIRG